MGSGPSKKDKLKAAEAFRRPTPTRADGERMEDIVEQLGNGWTVELHSSGGVHEAFLRPPSGGRFDRLESRNEAEVRAHFGNLYKRETGKDYKAS